MSNAKMAAVNPRGKQLPSLYDRWLLFAAVGLVMVGLLMVASSSIDMSYHKYNSPFHQVMFQSCYLIAGLIVGSFVARIPMQTWYKASSKLIIISLVLLILVLMPYIGHKINGSSRWLGIWIFRIQISELVKLLVIIYIAGYLVRRSAAVKQTWLGFLFPIGVLCIVFLLLLKEPDFGAGLVIMTTALGMIFLAGVPTHRFTFLLGLAIVGAVLIATSSHYRLMRITTFLHPWQHAYQSGYQLTQALIGFGRGGLFGAGLGESVQKLSYLPEPNSDFIFSVITEELGLVGAIAILAMYSILVFRALQIGRRAEEIGERFSAYIAYGIGLWIGIQVLINVGVNTGVLPTKGLTLPLISYGGSSLLVMCITLIVLFRIDHETRLMRYGYSNKLGQKKR